MKKFQSAASGSELTAGFCRSWLTCACLMKAVQRRTMCACSSQSFKGMDISIQGFPPFSLVLFSLESNHLADYMESYGLCPGVVKLLHNPSACVVSESLMLLRKHFDSSRATSFVQNSQNRKLAWPIHLVKLLDWTPSAVEVAKAMPLDLMQSQSKL